MKNGSLAREHVLHAAPRLMAMSGLPYTATVAVMHGKYTTPRVPLTTSCWARPVEDTGSDYAHKVTLQGSPVHLQMGDSWRHSVAESSDCNHPWVSHIPAFCEEANVRGWGQPDQSASLCCLEGSRRRLYSGLRSLRALGSNPMLSLSSYLNVGRCPICVYNSLF